MCSSWKSSASARSRTSPSARSATQIIVSLNAMTKPFARCTASGTTTSISIVSTGSRRSLRRRRKAVRQALFRRRGRRRLYLPQREGGRQRCGCSTRTAARGRCAATPSAASESFSTKSRASEKRRAHRRDAERHQDACATEAEKGSCVRARGHGRGGTAPRAHPREFAGERAVDVPLDGGRAERTASPAFPWAIPIA